MRALVLLALVPVVLWLTQTILLWRSGLPPRFRINAAGLPSAVKRANRVATNLALLAVLLGYPRLRGSSPLSYYVRFFPLEAGPRQLMHGLAAALLYLALLYLAWTATDNVRFRVRRKPLKLAQRLAAAPLTAFLAGLLEELLFRAVLLAELLESLDARVAVAIGVAVFAGAHYVRSVKRYWTLPGHLALGLLLCIAFVCTRGLWLSVGLHSGGVLMLMALRSVVRYAGPTWLVGASIFPYAGAAGLVALGLLTMNIWLCYGGAA